MDRNQRTLIVLVVALAAASAASYGVYRAVSNLQVREVEVAHTFVVAATRPIPTGTRITAADVKLVPWPERSQVPGAFSTVQGVINRRALAQVLENQPLTDTKLDS